MSIPEESAVAYSGKELFDLLITLTRTDVMRTKIRDKAQGTTNKVQGSKHKGQGAAVSKLPEQQTIRENGY